MSNWRKPQTDQKLIFEFTSLRMRDGKLVNNGAIQTSPLKFREGKVWPILPLRLQNLPSRALID